MSQFVSQRYFVFPDARRAILFANVHEVQEVTGSKHKKNEAKQLQC